MKAFSFLSGTALLVGTVAGLGATPAFAQSSQACRDACRATYGGGRSNQDYLDCVEICSQGTGGGQPGGGQPGGGGTNPGAYGCAYGSCYNDPILPNSLLR